MNSNFQLFVYGSLRSGFKSPAFEYISRYFTFIANAKVKGLLYDMGEYPAAVPTSYDSFIVGELYCINSTDEFGFAIAQLDDYEGVNAEEGETPLFKRVQSTVYDHDGKETTAWMYWFNGNVSGRPRIESGDVLEYKKQQEERPS